MLMASKRTLRRVICNHFLQQRVSVTLHDAQSRIPNTVYKYFDPPLSSSVFPRAAYANLYSVSFRRNVECFPFVAVIRAARHRQVLRGTGRTTHGNS